MNELFQFKATSNLTLHTVQAERNRLLLKLKNKTVKGLRFDLSEVNSCDSAGLALLVEVKSFCDKRKLKVVFDAIPKEVQALATFCGVENILV